MNFETLINTFLVGDNKHRHSVSERDAGTVLECGWTHNNFFCIVCIAFDVEPICAVLGGRSTCRL